MKICWDTLENMYLTRNGTLRKRNGTSYIEQEACKVCNGPFLMRPSTPTDFCGHSCAASGKIFTNKSKKKMASKQEGNKNSFWKGGVVEANIPLFDTYAHQISYAEEVCRDPENYNWLQVKCAYCGRWYVPTRTIVRGRIDVLNGKRNGETRFYCSENCKQVCPIFNQKKYPKGFKHATSREVDSHLRQMVLERDNWTCQICGKTVEEAQLHCHHMDPAAQNPMFQNDTDSCIALCKGCHGWVHTQYGCRYVDLRCK